MSCAVSKSLDAARMASPTFVFFVSHTSSSTSPIVSTGVTSVTRLVDAPRTLMVSEIQGMGFVTGCGCQESVLSVCSATVETGRERFSASTR